MKSKEEKDSVQCGLKESIKDSKDKGLKRLELDSGFHREKAHEFYMKLGFEKRAFLFSHPL